MKPIGIFVHHQGRGHAERVADLLHAMPSERPVTVFCAKPAVLPALPARVTVVPIPSLFEATGAEATIPLPQPDTVHCAPVGWPGIREAMGIMADWMRRADPALMLSDVSAEVAQMARLMSVPHVVALQHGDRTDPGHRAALDGAAGVLAPFDAALAQPDWDDAWLDRTCFAGGLGTRTEVPDRDAARARLGLEGEVVAVISGGGGTGVASAPLGVGARATPAATWVTIGAIERDWHATEPANLRHEGWVDNPMDYVAAADVVVASTGNTTVAQILSAGRPWIAVPEWRYFDEQVRKAEALARAGVAHHLPALPSSVPAWRAALAAARAAHDPARQRALIRPDAAAHAARWLDDLATRLWAQTPASRAPRLQLAGE